MCACTHVCGVSVQSSLSILIRLLVCKSQRALCRSILTEALTKHLLPVLKEEAVSRLRSEAREEVTQRACSALWDLLLVGPRKVLVLLGLDRCQASGPEWACYGSFSHGARNSPSVCHLGLHMLC